MNSNLVKQSLMRDMCHPVSWVAGSMWVFSYISVTSTNFSMERTALTITGFTQPDSALKLLCPSAVVKGFSARFSVFEPEPRFVPLNEAAAHFLNEDTLQEVINFEEDLGKLGPMATENTTSNLWAYMILLSPPQNLCDIHDSRAPLYCRY